MVEVVELTDAGDPGECHLGERGPGEAVVRVGLEPFGGPIHQLTPRPERAAIGLGARPQRSMEGVAVRVGEAGNGEAGEASGVARYGVDVDRR